MNLLTIKYSARLKHLFSLPSIVILLGACASSPEQRPEDDLATGLARIKMEYPTRTPNLFKERLFGRIKSFQTLSGDNLLGEPDYRPDAPAIRYLDVDPGTYKLKAECEPVIDYNEHPEIWLLNHTVNVQAGQILTLKCERYAIEQKATKGKKGSRSDYKPLLDKRVYAVRIIEELYQP